MRKRAVVVGFLAVAGLIALNTSAFTSFGLKNSATNWFVGGTVSHSLDGATLSNIAYTFTDAPVNSQIATVVLTFADGNSDGKTPSIVFTGGTPGTALCDVIAVTTHVSTCAVTAETGATSIAITVI